MPYDDEILDALGLAEGSPDANTSEPTTDPEPQATPDIGEPEPTSEPEQPASQEIEIEGEKYSAQELREALELRGSYTQKMQEIAEFRKEKEKLEPILQAITSPDKYDKVMSALKGEEQKIDKKEDELEAALNELDPSDPYAKSLQKALAEIQTLKSELQNYSSQQKENVDYLRQKQIQEQQEQYQKFIGEVKEYSSNGLEFENDVEKELFDIAFTASLANVDTRGLTAQEYKEIGREIGRLVHKDIIMKYKDSVTEKYRKSKTGGGEERLPATEKTPADDTALDLQQRIENLLGG
jgi:DNA repair exonuclease SbcCD ATPase subunit